LRKPDKPNHLEAKNYRVISLLNCLRKVVEKIAAKRISSFCERHEALHEGQFGCRKRRNAINAVAKLIATTKKAWQQKKLVGALFMDVKEAFNYVTRK
jgi:Reverse transcriptase (RNA-dependent DNA polymerase)